MAIKISNTIIACSALLAALVGPASASLIMYIDEPNNLVAVTGSDSGLANQFNSFLSLYGASWSFGTTSTGVGGAANALSQSVGLSSSSYGDAVISPGFWITPDDYFRFGIMASETFGEAITINGSGVYVTQLGPVFFDEVAILVNANGGTVVATALTPGFSSMTITTAPIPEASTTLLLFLGLTGLTSFRRRW